MAISQPTIIDSTDTTAADTTAAVSSVDSTTTTTTTTERVELYIPILPGETLEDIATKFETTVDAIVTRNGINPDWYFANQWIFV